MYLEGEIMDRWRRSMWFPFANGCGEDNGAFRDGEFSVGARCRRESVASREDDFIFSMTVALAFLALDLLRLGFPCPHLLEFAGIEIRGDGPAGHTHRALGFTLPKRPSRRIDTAAALDGYGRVIKVSALGKQTLTWSHGGPPQRRHDVGIIE